MGNHWKAWRGARRREGERTLRTQGAGGVEAAGKTGPFELATAVGSETPGEGQRRSRSTRVRLSALRRTLVTPCRRVKTQEWMCSTSETEWGTAGEGNLRGPGPRGPRSREARSIRYGRYFAC